MRPVFFAVCAYPVLGANVEAGYPTGKSAKTCQVPLGKIF
jgi:hypothetical protein